MTFFLYFYYFYTIFLQLIIRAMAQFYLMYTKFLFWKEAFYVTNRQ